VEILVIKILVGHFLGDFLFQTDKIAKKKMSEWRYLLLHIAMVFLSMLICTVGYISWQLIGAIAVISFLHIMDRLKINDEHSLEWFFVDQVFHLASIAVVPAFFEIWSISSVLKFMERIYYDPRIWVYVFGYIGGVFVSSIVIGKVLGSIKRAEVESTPLSPLAGKIGIIERLIVITLALFNQFTAIGIVFAIKGVARKTYVECNDFQGEIYFLGTGISFFLAILSAVIVKWLLLIV
jgi:hypothetical protein